MLCPKCGFISFDHLSACLKCHNDLSLIGSDLHGTATDAISRNFLGVVLMHASASQENPSEVEDMPIAIDLSFEQEEKVETTQQTEEKEEDPLGDEEITVAAPEQESPSLDFNFEERPSLDISSFEPADGAENSLAAEVAPEVVETASFDLEAENVEDRGDALLQPSLTMESLSDDNPEISADSVNIDTLCLTLDSVQSSDEGSEEEAIQDSSPLATEVESSGQLTIDLNEIDLSDLVHDKSDATSSSGDVAPSAEENGLDFEDTMDLSLFVGEDPDGTVTPATFFNDTGVEPIDLTLMDEALVELAVDPGRKEPSFEKEAPSEDLELSMEDNPK